MKALAQLDREDVKALRTLVHVFEDVIATQPHMHEPHSFTMRTAELLNAAGKAGLDRDTFHSSCKRLEGFGLATEVPRNNSDMAPGDYCFRPTRRGITLSALLSEEGAATER